MTNKKDITDKLNILKRAGWIVKTFNSHKKMPRGSVGFVDHFLAHEKYGIIFIEVKIGKDKMSEEQTALAHALSVLSASNLKIQYYQVTEVNVDNVIDKILRS